MTYRILTLDGGGSWALIEVRALIALYGPQTKGHDVLKHFDMAAANSGGSIVLGGLIENYTLQYLLDMFHDENKRRSFFPPIKHRALFPLVLSKFGIGPRYSAKDKLTGIQRIMPHYGTATLHDAAQDIKGYNGNSIHMAIVGFDYDRNLATFFRSAATGQTPESRLGIGKITNVTVAEAIHASTNAPINYFNAPAVLHNGRRYWDGAISGCNNPVMAAVVEALSLGIDAKEIRALSIGTGTTALPWPQMGEKQSPYVTQQSDTDIVTGIQKLAKAILDEPVDCASLVAHIITSAGMAPHDSHVVRMNPQLSPERTADGQWGPPGDLDEKTFTAIRDLDMDAIKPEDVRLIDKLTDQWLADKIANQPVRCDGDTLACELGDPLFSKALEHWMAIVAA